MDFGFTFAEGATSDNVDKDWGTTMVAVDRDTCFAMSYCTGTKESDDYTVKRLVDYLDRLHPRAAVEVRSDGENAMKSILARIAATREAPVTVSTGKTRDSQSMGRVESTIRWWRGKARTLRYDVEMKYGRKVTPDHAMWPYLVDISSCITSMYRVRVDGQTAHFWSVWHFIPR